MKERRLSKKEKSADIGNAGNGNKFGEQYDTSGSGTTGTTE